MTIGTSSSAGVLTFPSLRHAQAEGFEADARFCDARGTGWIVRKRVSGLWARAIVLDGGAQ